MKLPCHIISLSLAVLLYSCSGTEYTGQTIGEDYFICDAKLDLADRYVLSGMYSEALASAGSLDMQTVCSTGLLPRMLHIYHSLYTGLAETCDDPLLAKKYAGQIKRAFKYITRSR